MKLSPKTAHVLSSGLHPLALVGALVLLFFRDRLGITIDADQLLAIFAAGAGAAAAFERRAIAPAMRAQLDSRETAEAITAAVEQADEES